MNDGLQAIAVIPLCLMLKCFFWGGCAEIYCLQFLIAMDGKHFNEVKKAFIEVMNELDTECVI